MTKQEAQRIFEQTCKEVLKTTPLPHWTLLKNLKYFDAVVLGFGIDAGMKRDFGYGMNLTSNQEAENIVREMYSGSYYTTTKGHFIYFDDGRKPVSQMVLNPELNLMPNAVKFNIPRGRHSFLHGSNVGASPGKPGSHWTKTFALRLMIDHSEIKAGQWKPQQLDKPENQNSVSFINLHQLFTAIENGSAKIDPKTPVIITFNDEGIVSTMTIAKDLNEFLVKYGAVAGILLSLALPGIGVTLSATVINSIIMGATALTEKIKNGEQVNAEDIMKASNNLIPESAKPYIQKGLNIGKLLSEPTPQNLYNASKELGVKPENLKKIVGSVAGEGASGLLVNSMESGKFDDAVKILSVIKSQYTTQEAVKITDVNAFNNQIGKDGGIYKNAIAQNIATMSFSGIPSLVPNIDKIAGGILSTGWTELSNAEKRAWLNMGTFRPDLATKVPEMAIEVMKQQARDGALLGAPYVIPAEVPAGLKNCIALKITADTGVPVATSSVPKQEVPTRKTPTTKTPTKMVGKKKKRRLAFI
jgi:hypothetical protein